MCQQNDWRLPRSESPRYVPAVTHAGQEGAKRRRGLVCGGCLRPKSLVSGSPETRDGSCERSSCLALHLACAACTESISVYVHENVCVHACVHVCVQMCLAVTVCDHMCGVFASVNMYVPHVCICMRCVPLYEGMYCVCSYV